MGVLKKAVCIFITLFIITSCYSQQVYEGPYIEALVKYKFRINDKKENPGWGLGFRIDTANRRYVVIANDGWLTKSEFYYDSTGRVEKEISLQLSTGLKHIYSYTYDWLSPDTLQSIRNDYALNTLFIYNHNKLRFVEKTYLGSHCKIINERPAEVEAQLPDGIHCFERVNYKYDTLGRIAAKYFNYYYSQFKKTPNKYYAEFYFHNANGLVDSVVMADNGEISYLQLEYDKKGRIKQARRMHSAVAQYETWDFKYKRNGLLKKVIYNDYPGKKWVDKYRWKKHKWKKDYPVIPHLSNFITSYELKLAEDFYFAY